MISYLNSDWEDVWDWCKGVVSDPDLIIVDPPYHMNPLSYIPQLEPLLRKGGSMYVFGDSFGIAETKITLDHVGLTFQNWLIWGNDWGGRSKKRFGQKHDDILFYTKPPLPHYFDGQAVSVQKKMTQKVFNPSGRTTKIPSSVWVDLAGFSTMSKERVKVDGHCVRWQKPEAVIERIVKASSKPGDLVFDPFSGVATIPLVCARNERRCIAAEIDPKIHAAGCDRLKKEHINFQEVISENRRKQRSSSNR